MIDYEKLPLARLNEIANMWQSEQGFGKSQGIFCRDGEELEERLRKIERARQKLLDNL